MRTTGFFNEDDGNAGSDGNAGGMDDNDGNAENGVVRRHILRVICRERFRRISEAAWRTSSFKGGIVVRTLPIPGGAATFRVPGAGPMGSGYGMSDRAVATELRHELRHTGLGKRTAYQNEYQLLRYVGNVLYFEDCKV